MARAILVPMLTGASAGSIVRSHSTSALSCTVRKKLSDGPEPPSPASQPSRWCGSGGEKCHGAAERVVHAVSAGAVSGGPLRRVRASERDWDRRRSWAERKFGGGRSDGSGVVAVAVG